MSGTVVFDRQKLEIAFSEIDAIRKSLPASALTVLAQEVVRRVANHRRLLLTPEIVPTAGEIDTLCDALLAPDQTEAIALMEQAQNAGASYDALCLSYLAVAARQLGDWWDDDRVSFYQVTLAAGRIYAILRSLRQHRLTAAPDLRRSAVFASVPGENHTLGITIAADLARERGWDIELFVGRLHDQLVHDLERRETPLIGLSASGKRSLPALIKLIVALRISNPRANILVCGKITSLSFNLVGITGADAVAEDFHDALAQMERLIGQGVARPT